MSVTVTGRGRVSLVPDLAVVDLSCEGTGADPATALEAASAGVAAVRQVVASRLVDDGAASADIRSRDLGLWAETDLQGQPSGYRAIQSLTLVLRDLPSAGAVLAAAVAAGGLTTRLGGLRLEASDAPAAARRARDLAWGDALEAATHLATLAGRALGPVVEVLDGEPARGAVPMARAFVAAKDPGLAIDPGQLDVTAAVTVTWELT